MTHFLSKGDAPVKITARFVTVTGTWETSTGGASGLKGAFTRAKGVNLDNVGIFKAGPRSINYAGLDNLTPEEGVQHSGDDKRGKKPEVLTLELAKIPAHITDVVCAMAAFQPGQSFRNAKNVKVKISADEDYLVQPSITGFNNFLGVAKISRVTGGWVLTVVDESRQIPQGDFDALVNAASGM